MILEQRRGRTVDPRTKLVNRRKGTEHECRAKKEIELEMMYLFELNELQYQPSVNVYVLKDGTDIPGGVVILASHSLNRPWQYFCACGI
jgi:hypothetical protein